MLSVSSNAFTSFDPTPSIDEPLKNRAEIILGAVQVVAAAIAVGMIIYVGIKYVMSSANERAEVKQSAINFTIGAIVIAGAPKLFTLLYKFFVQAKNGG